MLSKTLHKQMLEQVKYEWESEFLYLAMMAWCYNNDYEGFAAWFYQQAREERLHGEMILAYVANVGGEISIPSVNCANAKFKDLEDVFAQTYKHEQKVTKLINELVETAIKDHDHAANTFLQWYVKEQVEEEAHARTILTKIQRCKNAPDALLFLEKELGARGTGLPANPPAESAE